MQNCRLYNVQVWVGPHCDRTEGVIVSAPNAKKAIELTVNYFGFENGDKLRAKPISPLKNKVIWQYASGDIVYGN